MLKWKDLLCLNEWKHYGLNVGRRRNLAFEFVALAAALDQGVTSSSATRVWNIASGLFSMAREAACSAIYWMITVVQKPDWKPDRSGV